MFGAAAGHCNAWVGRAKGEDAGEDVNVSFFMFKDMVLELHSDNGIIVFVGNRVCYGGRLW